MTTNHTCTCGHELVRVDLVIDGVDFTMSSCSDCGSRRWHRDGEPTALDGVLTDITSSISRYRRDLAHG
ncbi:MAG: hypothetical protein U0Q22_12135 [Acidimicrobiales bacterium]